MSWHRPRDGEVWHRPRDGEAWDRPREGAPGLPRRAVLLGAGAAWVLAGCGFSPALSPGGGGRGRVAVEAPPTREGFALRRRLEDRLGTAGEAAPYRLAVAIDLDPEAAVVDPAQVTTRVRLEGAASYALTEAATGRERLRGAAEAFTAYDATGTTVALDASARDAEDRLMAILADRIAARLLAAGLT